MSRTTETQLGFSLVELLVAAFVLGVGVLGLTLLQVSVVKINTSSASTTRGLAVANSLLETAASEGRRSMLWTVEQRAPVVANYTSAYIGPTGTLAGTVTRYLTPSGKIFTTLASAQGAGELVYTTTMTPSNTVATSASIQVLTASGAAQTVTTTLSRSSVFTVEVSWLDSVVSQSGATTNVKRYVRLARRVNHA